MAIENAEAKYPGPLPGDPESLFERCSWFYAFCREHLFRDHTAAISHALWPGAEPSPETHLLEIACGPGFYACSLAQRYPDIQITGVDLSERLLSRAKDRAYVRQLEELSFHQSECSCPLGVLCAGGCDHRLPVPDGGGGSRGRRCSRYFRLCGRAVVASSPSPPPLYVPRFRFHACGFSPA